METRPSGNENFEQSEEDQSDDVLFIVSLHATDGSSLILEERTIYLSAVPEAKSVDFLLTPPGSWLLEHVPWTEAEHRIWALNANATMAQALEIKPGDACLVVERKTWRLGATITQVRQIFRGSAYRLLAPYTPSGN